MRMLTPWTTAWITAALVLTPLSLRLAHKFKRAVLRDCMRSCRTPRPFREQRVGDGIPIVRPERSAAAARIVAGAFVADGVPRRFNHSKLLS
jgi:hypothetical protein